MEASFLPLPQRWIMSKERVSRGSADRSASFMAWAPWLPPMVRSMGFSPEKPVKSSPLCLSPP